VDKSGARSEGGSGLGLAIVKHIIEAHNEKIFVESKFGVGSKFSFTLQKVLN
jgi:two-component system phosphate regulon sensor histidine kinase PhoR